MAYVSLLSKLTGVRHHCPQVTEVKKDEVGLPPAQTQRWLVGQQDRYPGPRQERGGQCCLPPSLVRSLHMLT